MFGTSLISRNPHCNLGFTLRAAIANSKAQSRKSDTATQRHGTQRHGTQHGHLMFAFHRLINPAPRGWQILLPTGDRSRLTWTTAAAAASVCLCGSSWEGSSLGWEVGGYPIQQHVWFRLSLKGICFFFSFLQTKVLWWMDDVLPWGRFPVIPVPSVGLLISSTTTATFLIFVPSTTFTRFMIFFLSNLAFFFLCNLLCLFSLSVNLGKCTEH